MKSLRPFVPFLVLAFVLGVLVTAVQKPQELRRKAAPATTLSFVPSSTTVQRGAAFTLDVAVDTGENTISAVDLTVSFDKDRLKAQAIVAGDFLTTVLVSGSITDSQAKITLGSPPTFPHKGKGKLATVTFQAKGEGTTQVRVDDATQVAGIGEGDNVVVGKTPATVTITGGGGGPQPSPAPTPTANSRPPASTSTSTPTSTPRQINRPPDVPSSTSSPQSSCQNTCGDGVCQKEPCGESAFTCSADCKAGISVGGNLNLPTEEIKQKQKSLFEELIRKFFNFFSINL